MAATIYKIAKSPLAYEQTPQGFKLFTGDQTPNDAQELSATDFSGLATRYGFAPITDPAEQSKIQERVGLGLQDISSKIKNLYAPTQTTSPATGSTVVSTPTPAPITTTPTGVTPTPTISDIKASATPSTPAPKAPNLVEQYNQLIKEQGVDTLEKSIVDYDALIKAEQDAARQYGQAQEGTAVAQDIASGKAAEENRKRQVTIDTLQRQKETAVNQLANKYKAIGVIMDLTKADYSTAKTAYDDEYQKNIQAIQLLDNKQGKADTAANVARDDARATLNIIQGQIAKNGLTYDTLPPDQKNLITQLELKAGFPAGITQFLQGSVKGDVVATTSRTAPNGIEYYDILTRNPDGGFSVKTITRGESRVTGTGTDASVITNTEKDKQYPTVPESLVGKSEQQLLDDLKGSAVPQWFKDTAAFASQAKGEQGFILRDIGKKQGNAAWDAYRVAALRDAGYTKLADQLAGQTGQGGGLSDAALKAALEGN